jgi:hypothetical protein
MPQSPIRAQHSVNKRGSLHSSLNQNRNHPKHPIGYFVNKALSSPEVHSKQRYFFALSLQFLSNEINYFHNSNACQSRSNNILLCSGIEELI